MALKYLNFSKDLDFSLIKATHIIMLKSLMISMKCNLGMGISILVGPHKSVRTGFNCLVDELSFDLNGTQAFLPNWQDLHVVFLGFNSFANT